jgi:DedD protein
MAEGQDTEITLGTGRLLALFFGLVVVCGVFFGLGFSLGRNSVKAGSLTMEQTPAAVQATGTSSKSNAGTPERVAPAVVVQSADAQQAPATPPPTVVSPATATPTSATPPPEMARPAASSGGGAYTVQVAAVSKQEDADALVDALKKKSYPVFAANVATDKLIHVQVGPFGDIKDAEAMKAKLMGDGYNPIVKR